MNEPQNGRQVTITWEVYRAYVCRLQEAENSEEDYKKRYRESQKQLKSTEERVEIYNSEFEEEKQKNNFLTAENAFMKEELIRLQDQSETQERPEGSWSWSPKGLLTLGLCAGVATVGAVLLANTFKTI